MMPAELVLRTVPVAPDAGPKLAHFLDELLAGHRTEVAIHLTQLRCQRSGVDFSRAIVPFASRSS